MMKNYGIVFWLVCIGSSMTAQDFRSVLLLHPSGSFFASGLNNAGQVCGSVLVDDVNFVNHAIRFEPDGSFKTLVLGPLGISATASGINDHGHVIGVINRSDFTAATVIWETDSTFRELQDPMSGGTVIPQDVNNRGEAVGYIFNFNGTNEAVFWDATGNIEVLPRPEGGAEARALNDSSQIAGMFLDSLGNRLPMRWDPVDSVPARSENGFAQVPIFRPQDGFGEATGINNASITWGIADRTGIGNAFTFSDSEGLEIEESEGEIFDINIFGSRVGVSQVGPNAFSSYIKIGTICKDPDGLTDGSLASAVSIKEINDDNWVIAGDVNSQNQLWQHNFTYTLDQNALPSSTVNRFQTWADVRASILQNSVTGPAILPLIVKFEAGNYDREPIIFRDSWAPSANLRIAPGVRIEELQTENDMDANILPRIGLTYEPGGILKVSQFKSNGNLCIDVPIQIQRFILNAAEQNLKLSANNSFSAEVFDVASSLTLSGQVITDQIVLSGQVIAEDLLSGIILTNSDPDLFANGFNSPVEGSPAFTEGEFAHVNGLFERRTDAFNVWNAPQDNEGYFFPLRDPLIIQPTGQTVSGAAVDVSTQVIESIEANLQMPIEYQEGNLADFEIVSPRVYRIGVRLRFNRRTPLTDPLEANVRVPAASLGEVADPNLYRLLIFDCDGNLVGPAGTFIPSAEEAQTALLYTGSIDGVYNISHSGVLLDSCQYLAIAKGEMTTAVIEPDGLKQGFALHANHPNPFREITHIEYTLPCTSLVHLNVFNLLGQKVSTLVNAIQPDGDYSISWNARSDSGATVDAGAYYYQIEFTDPTRSSYRFVQNKKMILIR